MLACGGRDRWKAASRRELSSLKVCARMVEACTEGFRFRVGWGVGAIFDASSAIGNHQRIGQIRRRGGRGRQARTKCSVRCRKWQEQGRGAVGPGCRGGASCNRQLVGNEFSEEQSRASSLAMQAKYQRRRAGPKRKVVEREIREGWMAGGHMVNPQASSG